MADPEQEKEAIMNVILDESLTARDGDFEGLMSTCLDNENTIRLYYTRTNYEVSKGIKEIGAFLECIKEYEAKDISGVTVSEIAIAP